MKKFGKQIFVVMTDDADGDLYLTAFDDQTEAIETAGHGEKVAVYVLDRVLTAEITHKFK